MSAKETPAPLSLPQAREPPLLPATATRRGSALHRGHPPVRPGDKLTGTVHFQPGDKLTGTEVAEWIAIRMASPTRVPAPPRPLLTLPLPSQHHH